jgi:hypothetical protein
MTYSAPEERARFITGLRELAAFLDSNPETPAPVDTTVYVFPPADGSDTEHRAEIDVIASRLFTRAYKTTGGHYVASRFFGPVEYRAVAIPHETTDELDRA